jgi:hypothetical protein
MCRENAKNLHRAAVEVGGRENCFGGCEIGVGGCKKHGSHAPNSSADSGYLPTASSKSSSTSRYTSELILADSELPTSPLNHNSNTLS